MLIISNALLFFFHFRDFLWLKTCIFSPILCQHTHTHRKMSHGGPFKKSLPSSRPTRFQTLAQVMRIIARNVKNMMPPQCPRRVPRVSGGQKKRCGAAHNKSWQSAFSSSRVYVRLVTRRDGLLFSEMRKKRLYSATLTHETLNMWQKKKPQLRFLEKDFFFF